MEWFLYLGGQAIAAFGGNPQAHAACSQAKMLVEGVLLLHGAHCVLTFAI